MDRLDLSRCKTNIEVCKAVSARVLELSFEELVKKVNKKFVFQEKTTRAIYIGLSMNMNVFLNGPGGYGKSQLIKFILDIYKIPYTTIVGYKDMPVDALLGVPNIDKLLKDSEYEINFKKSTFYHPGILIAEEFTDILPSTAAALKDILTERGYRNKNNKIESLISTVIIAANKSADELSVDQSSFALYKDRFPLQVNVIWEDFSARSYFKLLKLYFEDAKEEKLFFLAKLFENNVIEHSINISPRVALDITRAFLRYGLDFIEDFNINTSFASRIVKEAKDEYEKMAVIKSFEDIKKSFDAFEEDKHTNEADILNYYYYILNKLNDLNISGNNIVEFSAFKNMLVSKIEDKTKNNNVFKDLDNMIKDIK